MQTLTSLLELLLGFEINKDDWRTLLTGAKARLPEIIARRNDFLQAYQGKRHEYDNLLTYFLYRHFMKALGDDAVQDKVQLALVSTAVIQLLDVYEWLANGELTHWAQICICKAYSREIEYNEDNTEQLAVRGAVIGNSHGGVTGALLQLEDFLKGGVRLYVGVGYDEACLVALYAGNHGSLTLDRLRTEDKGDTALLRQCDRHTIIRYRLHDCGNHRNVGIQRGFLALFVLNDWCAQAYVRRHALRRGIPRYQQIFVKGMRRFTEIIRHFVVLLFSK